jgi:hypothetical protein
VSLISRKGVFPSITLRVNSQLSSPSTLKIKEISFFRLIDSRKVMIKTFFVAFLINCMAFIFGCCINNYSWNIHKKLYSLIYICFIRKIKSLPKRNLCTYLILEGFYNHFSYVPFLSFSYIKITLTIFLGF